MKSARALTEASRRLVQEQVAGPAPRGVGHGDTAWLLAAELGIRGPVMTVSTASTTALVLAADALAAGEIESALVVGVDVLSLFVHAGFEAIGAVSPPDRAPSPFGADRAGLWLGEAAAAVFLRRMGPHRALYLGGATAGDGVHMTAPDREAGGYRRAVQGALQRAGNPRIDWVSAHATGTRFNDGMEATGLQQLFGEHPPPIHAIKPVIGHTLGACGLVEVVLATLVLQHQRHPPTFQRSPYDPTLPPLPLDAVPVNRPTHRILSTNSAFAGHNVAVVLGRAE